MFRFGKASRRVLESCLFEEYRQGVAANTLFAVDMPRHMDTAARGSDLRTYFYLFSSPRFEIRYDARKLIRGLYNEYDFLFRFRSDIPMCYWTLSAPPPPAESVSLSVNHMQAVARTRPAAPMIRTENLMGLVLRMVLLSFSLVRQTMSVQFRSSCSTIENAPVELLVGRWVMVIMGP